MKKKRRDDIPISLRLDPRRRYLLDLLARTQHRTMTGVIEAAIMEAAQKVELAGKPLSERLEELWASEEAERIARLAILERSRLKIDEDAIWEVVLKTPDFWRKNPADSADISLSNLRIGVLIDQWDKIKEFVENHGAGKPFPFRQPPSFTLDND